MGTDRLEQIKMRLPSLNKGPDWNYMESYIKSLPYSYNLEIHN